MTSNAENIHTSSTSATVASINTIIHQQDKLSPKIEPKPYPKIDPTIECNDLTSIIKELYGKYLEDDYINNPWFFINNLRCGIRIDNG